MQLLTSNERLELYFKMFNELIKIKQPNITNEILIDCAEAVCAEININLHNIIVMYEVFTNNLTYQSVVTFTEITKH